MFLNFIEQISVAEIGGRLQKMNIADVFPDLTDVAGIVSNKTADQNFVALRIELQAVENMERIVQKIGFGFKVKIIVQVNFRTF